MDSATGAMLTICAKSGAAEAREWGACRVQPCSRSTHRASSPRRSHEQTIAGGKPDAGGARASARPPQHSLWATGAGIGRSPTPRLGRRFSILLPVPLLVLVGLNGGSSCRQQPLPSHPNLCYSQRDRAKTEGPDGKELQEAGKRPRPPAQGNAGHRPAPHRRSAKMGASPDLPDRIGGRHVQAAVLPPSRSMKTTDRR